MLNVMPITSGVLLKRITFQLFKCRYWHKLYYDACGQHLAILDSQEKKTYQA